MCSPFLCSTILSATAPCERSLPDAVTLQSLLCSMATSLVRLGNPRYCCSFLGMLICDVPVSITVWALGKCSQQSFFVHISRMSLPCVSWHPSAATSSYVRASSMSVCSFDVGRCTFASHCTPAFLSDACHHRTLHHCWLRSTGEGNLFFSCSYCFLALHCLPSRYDSVCSLQGSEGLLVPLPQ